jgi:hypothetical protein
MARYVPNGYTYMLMTPIADPQPVDGYMVPDAAAMNYSTRTGSPALTLRS